MNDCIHIPLPRFFLYCLLLLWGYVCVSRLWNVALLSRWGTGDRDSSWCSYLHSLLTSCSFFFVALTCFGFFFFPFCFSPHILFLVLLLFSLCLFSLLLSSFCSSLQGHFPPLSSGKTNMEACLWISLKQGHTNTGSFFAGLIHRTDYLEDIYNAVCSYTSNSHRILWLMAPL